MDEEQPTTIYRTATIILSVLLLFVVLLLFLTSSNSKSDKFTTNVTIENLSMQKPSCQICQDCEIVVSSCQNSLRLSENAFQICNDKKYNCSTEINTEKSIYAAKIAELQEFYNEKQGDYDKYISLCKKISENVKKEFCDC